MSNKRETFPCHCLRCGLDWDAEVPDPVECRDCKQIGWKTVARKYTKPKRRRSRNS